MVIKRPKIVIIGAGMAGLAAANKLHTCPNSKHQFELLVVEGGKRIGGRISSAEFCGNRVEQGATWIHGIEGSPVYEIARAIGSFEPDGPWECMDGILHCPVTVAEGGHVLPPSLVEPVSRLFKSLMDLAQGKDVGAEVVRDVSECESVGAFLKAGMETYLANVNEDGEVVKGVGNWGMRCLREAIFEMHQGTQRTYTAADDLGTLDYGGEKEYVMFPGEEMTIARGYSSVVESLASALPAGMIQLGRRVERIEWQAVHGIEDRPVKLHFCDGSTMSADHVIVTVSLGVLKQGIKPDSCLFNPPLPDSKTQAIASLGYGVVDKVFLQISDHDINFPFLQMAFHPPDSELRDPKIPHWIRRASSLCPIYRGSSTVLSWFTGHDALRIESLTEEEIISGFLATVSNMLPSKTKSQFNYNGSTQLKFTRVLRTQWGTDPLFLGSYCFIAVGSNMNDINALAEPLPLNSSSSNLNGVHSSPPLQILFAGEATHPTHYSTTHGAYFSGLKEANRLLKHYNYINAD